MQHKGDAVNPCMSAQEVQYARDVQRQQYSSREQYNRLANAVLDLGDTTWRDRVRRADLYVDGIERFLGSQLGRTPMAITVNGEPG